MVLSSAGGKIYECDKLVQWLRLFLLLELTGFFWNDNLFELNWVIALCMSPLSSFRDHLSHVHSVFINTAEPKSLLFQYWVQFNSVYLAEIRLVLDYHNDIPNLSHPKHRTNRLLLAKRSFLMKNGIRNEK